LRATARGSLVKRPVLALSTPKPLLALPSSSMPPTTRAFCRLGSLYYSTPEIVPVVGDRLVAPRDRLHPRCYVHRKSHFYVRRESYVVFAITQTTPDHLWVCYGGREQLWSSLFAFGWRLLRR